MKLLTNSPKKFKIGLVSFLLMGSLALYVISMHSLNILLQMM